AYRFTYTDSRTGQTQTLESNYDYGVAPQYGSQLTYEKTDAPLEEPSIQIEQRIGQVPKAVGG
ncbi:MAG: hypothetical protein ACRDKJ_01430, partial [Actinomycetota bacterium]